MARKQLWTMPFTLLALSHDYSVLNWTTDFDAGINIAITRKHSWEYERETRIIEPEGSSRYLRFLPESLRAIIISCSAPPATVEKLRDLVQERSAAGLPAPKFYRTVKHKTKYKLLLRAEPNL